eukprot:3356028-Pyramimonas_sp.AAC.1
MLGAIVWMLGAIVWMLGAIVWLLRAIVWMLRAIVWMLRAALASPMLVCILHNRFASYLQAVDLRLFPLRLDECALPALLSLNGPRRRPRRLGGGGGGDVVHPLPQLVVLQRGRRGSGGGQEGDMRGSGRVQGARSLDTDTVELTIKTLLSHLITRELNSPPMFRKHRMSVSSPRDERRAPSPSPKG